VAIFFRTGAIFCGEARAYPREYTHTLVPRSKGRLLKSSAINGLLPKDRTL
jgi:hypothetical protein